MKPFIKIIKFSLLAPFLSIILMLPSALIAQTLESEIDSLLNILKTANDDTNKVMILRDISWNYKSINYEKAMLYANQCLDLANKIGDQVYIGKALTNLGSCYYTQGDFINAETNFILALKIGEEIGNNSIIAGSLNSIGNIYGDKSDYAKSIEYYLKALKLTEEMGEMVRVGQIMVNIGACYQEMKNSELALQYYKNALPVLTESHNKDGLANCYSNIGSHYLEKKEFSMAKENFLKSREVYEEAGDSLGISHSDFALGVIHEVLTEYDSALKSYFKAVEIGRQFNDNAWIAEYLHNIGEVYRKTGNLELAVQHLNQSLEMATEMSSMFLMTIIYKALAETYRDLSNKSASSSDKIKYLDQSITNYQLYSSLKDSTFSQESSKQVAEMQTKYDTEKKDTEIKLLNKDKEVAEADKKKQSVILYSVISGLILFVFFSIFIYRGYKQKKMANLQLERKKIEIEQKNSALENANVEITIKKKEIEEKNHEVLSSIRYAKRIQDAMLKDEEKVTSHLPDHFVLFKPKDIVSGDFYWAYEKNNYWYVAAADCTGHGVPGAFLTLLGMSFLNEIMVASERPYPASILNMLRDRIMKELGQTGRDGESKDGMDISLMALNLKTAELEWAGANNAMYIIRNEENAKPAEITELKPDKQPIGYFPDIRPFTNHTVQLTKGDSLYVFSDGYADQFGGPKGKKFKYSQFEKLLLSIKDKPLPEQKEMLNCEIEKWKGELEQIDDICIIGVRI